jgi:hypothetical protein
VYVEASTQTVDNGTPANTRTEMKPPMSFKRKLLQQAQEDKLQRERMRSASIKMEGRSPALKDVTSNKPSPLPPSPPLEDPSAMEITLGPASVPRPKELTPAKEPSPAPNADVDMVDADEAAAPKVAEPKVEEMTDAPVTEVTKEVAQFAMNPPAPPWPATSPARQSPTPSADGSAKSVDMRMDMPTKPDLTNPFPKDSVSTPGVTGTPSVESPVAIASPFSPAVQEAVNPTPVRKKLSLSEFASRRAKLAQTTSTSGTPPLASQSTSSPTLSAASLPTASPTSKTAELSLPVVTEEPQSIQTVAVATTAPTPT